MKNRGIIHISLIITVLFTISSGNVNSQELLDFKEIEISATYACHGYHINMRFEETGTTYKYLNKSSLKNTASRNLKLYEVSLVRQVISNILKYEDKCPEEFYFGSSKHIVKLDNKTIKLKGCSIDSIGTVQLERLLSNDLSKLSEGLKHDNFWKLTRLIEDTLAKELKGYWNINSDFNFVKGNILCLTRASKADTLNKWVWSFNGLGIKSFWPDSLQSSISLFERKPHTFIEDYNKWYLGAELKAKDDYLITVNRHDNFNFTNGKTDNGESQLGIIKMKFKELYSSETTKILELVLVE